METEATSSQSSSPVVPAQAPAHTSPPTLAALPAIPAKRYFTIGEVSELCGVKPHVLRYWEQEFTQLKPLKRRGNRRYYQHHEVLLIRRIRELLYEHGFTINGARNRLEEPAGAAMAMAQATSARIGSPSIVALGSRGNATSAASADGMQMHEVRIELQSILGQLEA
jgi:DNA-binding transcriptional MerR regulator